MKPCLRKRKPSLKYKFYDEYESDESDTVSNPEEQTDTDEDVSFCHDCDQVFENVQQLHKHLLKHIKQPRILLEKLRITSERAPIKLTLKGCESGEFAVVLSPTSEKEFPSIETKAGSSGIQRSAIRTFRKPSAQTSVKTDDDYEEKYIIPDSDPVAGGSSDVSGAGVSSAASGLINVPPKSEPEGYDEEEEGDDEENTMNVSFSPNYAHEGMLHQDYNTQASHRSSNKTTSDIGYGSNIPGAQPTPPPEPSATPDHLMPKIRIKSSGLLMAPERESPQGLTITEITEGEDTGIMEHDPFAGVASWTTGGATNTSSTTSCSGGMDDPLRLPDSIETDGNIISNLFTKNTDRAKDLGLTSSDSEFISLEGLGGSDGNRSNNNNSAVAIYNPNNNSNTTTPQSLLPTSVSTALVGLPMQQLAQQVSRLQQQQPGQAGQQMHQQNVLINIQQFPQAPQQQQPVQPQQQQVQPYGMYHHQYPGAYGQQTYGHPHHQGAYGQPYAQPNLFYGAPPPTYPTAQTQHMPPPPPPQQPTQAYIVQSAPQQQQQPPQQQPIILGTVGQLAPGQGQQQPYGQQSPGQTQQVSYATSAGVQQQQQPGQLGQQGQQTGPYNQTQQQQQSQMLNQQQQQQHSANRMSAPRAPGQVGGTRMGVQQRGSSSMGMRAPYSPRGGTRPTMIRGRGATQMVSMRGRPRVAMNVQQNGIRQPVQGTPSPLKRTPEHMAAIAAKRRRMETAQQSTTIKVEEEDDDEDDCEVVSVQQKMEPAAKLPKIQSVQGAVADPETAPAGVVHLSDSITLSIRQPPPRPPSPQAQSNAKQVANVLAARGITVTAAPKENKQLDSPVPISHNNAVRLVPNKSGKKDDHTPTVDLTDEVRVPPPKSLPPPSSSSNTAAAINGQAGANTTSTVPPPQPFKCDQCPARYGTNVALVRHRQAAHKTCNQMDYGVPLIDLRQPGIMSKLTNFGIYNYIPLPAANVSGMFALPVISMNAVKNNVNLSALGNSMLTLGPIRKIQKGPPGAGGSSNTPHHSPPTGRPSSNPTTPTK